MTLGSDSCHAADSNTLSQLSMTMDGRRLYPTFRFICLLLCYYVVCVSAWNNNSIKYSSKDINFDYDYIIIGGGTSGLTVADRLSEDREVTVLVVEVGYPDDSDQILYPSRGYAPWEDVYNMTTTRQASLANRFFPVWAGAVVGGSSAVNGMILHRGSRNDYDEWERLGNPGWGWNALLPYFKKSVKFTPPLQDSEQKHRITYDIEEAYNEDGPVQASFSPFQYPGQRIMWDAWDEMGPIFTPREHANGQTYGRIMFPASLDPVKCTRSYSKIAHYDRVSHRKNYDLLVGHRVVKILFSEKLRATSVHILPRGDEQCEVMEVKARKEIILAAGALHTPQVLQLSGIGPKQVLKAAGIEVLLDLPGVGRNLQDHPITHLIYNFTTNVWPNPEALQKNVTFREEASQEYEERRTGPYTVPSALSGVFLPLQNVTYKFADIVREIRSQDAATHLIRGLPQSLVDGYARHLEILANAMASNTSSAYEFLFLGGSTATLGLLKPLSRGTVTLNPAKPLGEPVVDFRAFSNPVDLKLFVIFVQYMRRYFKTRKMARFGPVERSPGPLLVTDEAIADALTSKTAMPSMMHPVGTAAMMPLDMGGVVGPDLLVYGVEGLSVVDAAMQPIIPGAHTLGTVYAVAEKAADIIKERHSTTYVDPYRYFDPVTLAVHDQANSQPRVFAELN